MKMMMKNELGVTLEKEEDDNEVVVVEVEDDHDDVEGGVSEVMQWEKLLPRMMIRVLLVEADDSTRQIIAALLRKCNYKVAAISDGLKAWEILKRKHNNIDLILTELDLPSISGYALLTLIMEHDGCKNIPVIITSSQDSISMVLKCMLKGAADFLIKPVRKNELKNLWRHVWKRLSTNPQNLTTGLCKAEATFENHPANNHSSDNISSSRKNSKVSEKATAAQDLSSLIHTQEDGLSLKELKHHTKKIKVEKELVLDTSDKRQETTVSAALRATEDVSCIATATEDGIVGPENHRQRENDIMNFHELPEPSSEAVDLIGRINKPNCMSGQSGVSNGLNSLSSTPGLELSLRRSHDAEFREVDERHILNHSTASAFSWYSSNKKPRTLFPSSIDDLTGTQATADNSAWPSALSSNEGNKPNTHVAQSAQGEAAPTHPQIGFAHLPGVRSSYIPTFQTVFSTPKDLKAKSPNSAFQREESPYLTSPSPHSDPGAHSSTLEGGPLGEAANSSSGHKLETTGSVDPRGSSLPCNDITSTNRKSSAYGSISEVTDANAAAPSIMGVNVVDESVKDDGSNSFDPDKFRSRTAYHSAEREAALAKFRLKRKGRCFEKKVRYQSRKRLAEQRPRVKGQFVRQAPSDQVLADADMP